MSLSVSSSPTSFMAKSKVEKIEQGISRARQWRMDGCRSCRDRVPGRRRSPQSVSRHSVQFRVCDLRGLSASGHPEGTARDSDFWFRASSERGFLPGTWVSHKFNHRVPDDKVLLRLFTTGGKADVLGEIREKLGITAEPIFIVEHNWPQSMPQYNVGHTQIVKVIEGMIKDLPGLHVVGNAYYGIGIPDCIKMARQVAARIAGT